MKKKSSLAVLIMLVAFAIWSCGGGGGGGKGGGGGDDNNDNNDNNNGTITKQNVAVITVTDASKNPVVSGVIQLSNMLAAPIGGDLVTDANGAITIPSGGLAPGKYKIGVSKGGTSTEMDFSVGENNSISEIKMITPLSNDGATWTSLDGTAVIASISGAVYNGNSQPVDGATVTLSGGAATNGAVATAITDASGRYDLLINADITKKEALQNSTVAVSAEGYNPHQLAGYELVKNTVSTGLNFVLTTANTQADVLWQERFETATANNWTVESTDASVTWNLRSAGVDITNRAYTDGLVKLAPDDTSAGKVPNPAEGTKAFWYGDTSKGNFLGTTASTSNSFDGGTSNAENSGTLTSPVINLSTVAANQPVSLTFKTWWEIESVNPNQDGFDLLGIEIKIGGGNWTPIARLNPLSDPQDSIDRDPIPYSNTGYNSAPQWTPQEAIPLKNVQGQAIQLRFVFDTVDGLYNGFRGWMIDDVVIQAAAGTFPLIDDTFDDNTTDDTTDDNNTTDDNAVLTGGCTLMTDALFEGRCIDYYYADEDAELMRAGLKNTCEDGGSVFYADGCPATIGSSTRLGKCTIYEGGTIVTALAWYSPETGNGEGESMCAPMMGGTWISD
jgi:hypothetical protein